MKTSSKLALALKIIFVIIIVLAIVAAVILPYVLKEKKSTGTLDELSKETLLKETDFTEAYAEAFDAKNNETYYARSEKMTSLVNVNDLHLPSKLTDQTNRQQFGLYIYNGSSFVLYDQGKQFVSPDKKTIFYAHGMGVNGTLYNARAIYNSGYNVLCLKWGAFADEDATTFTDICEKVWMHDSPMRYRSKDGEGWVSGSDIDYSVAEIYAAYYLDFLTQNPDCLKNEILIMGHSYGGMLTSALLSYLTTAFKNGLLKSEFLPDRAALLDPFFVKGGDYSIRWLGDEKNDYYGGTIYLSKQAYIAAHALGISVSLIRTSGLITTSFMLTYPIKDVTVGLDTVNAETFYIDADALGMYGIAGASPAHQYGEWWPARTTHPVYDTNKPTDYAYSFFNPYHADFARVKTAYIMDFHYTPDDLTDDTITLKSELNGYKVYGFAYLDRNGDGEMNERLSSHIKGATVTLTDKNGKETTVTTGINGYYEFILPVGEYTLTLSSPDYTAKKEKLTVTVDGSKNFVFAPMPFAAK